MKRLLLVILLIISIFCLSKVFAAQAHYYVIGDAGSTGTRFHVFKHNNDNKMPLIVDVFSIKNTIPLASFSETPEQAYASLKPLLENIAHKIQQHHIPTPVPISILATASMRLLTTDKQERIYQYIQKGIADDFKNLFILEKIQTISGKMEGVFGWLDVNYLMENFQHHNPTVGSIDIGGASTEIAYATEKSQKPIDETTLTINGKNYIIYSKSFLGLGINEAQTSIKADPHANHCYPSGYKEHALKGKFDLASCSTLYQQLLDNYHMSDLGLHTYKMPTFIAYSGAYYIFQFFGVHPFIPSQDTLEQTIIMPTCNNSWETLKEAYPAETEKHLASYCANSIFLSNLFYDGFQLQQKQIHIASNIKDHSISWPLGALLYTIINPDPSLRQDNKVEALKLT